MRLALKFLLVLLFLLGVYVAIEGINMWLHDQAHRKMEEIARKDEVSHSKENFHPISQNVAIPSLSKILQADSILIKEEWFGLSPIAPINSHFTLNRTGKTFRGTAQFSAGHDSRAKSKVAEIEISAIVVDKFLKMLAAIPLTEGVYKPRIEHTDDYPNIRIEILVDNNQYIFFTKSQGEHNIPWGINFSEKEYVTESTNISNALTSLDPYLKREVQKKLIEEIQSR